MELSAQHMNFLAAQDLQRTSVPDMIFPFMDKFDVCLSDALKLIRLWVIHRAEARK